MVDAPQKQQIEELYTLVKQLQDHVAYLAQRLGIAYTPNSMNTVAPSTLPVPPTALKPGEGVNVGQRFIPSDPRRTETGMGPLVDAGKSSFV